MKTQIHVYVLLGMRLAHPEILFASPFIEKYLPEKGNQLSIPWQNMDKWQVIKSPKQVSSIANPHVLR
jgi:hypothetical protein